MKSCEFLTCSLLVTQFEHFLCLVGLLRMNRILRNDGVLPTLSKERCNIVCLAPMQCTPPLLRIIRCYISPTHLLCSTYEPMRLTGSFLHLKPSGASAGSKNALGYNVNTVLALMFTNASVMIRMLIGEQNPGLFYSGHNPRMRVMDAETSDWKQDVNGWRVSKGSAISKGTKTFKHSIYVIHFPLRRIFRQQGQL